MAFEQKVRFKKGIIWFLLNKLKSDRSGWFFLFAILCFDWLICFVKTSAKLDRSISFQSHFAFTAAFRRQLLYALIYRLFANNSTRSSSVTLIQFLFNIKFKDIFCYHKVNYCDYVMCSANFVTIIFQNFSGVPASWGLLASGAASRLDCEVLQRRWNVERCATHSARIHTEQIRCSAERIRKRNDQKRAEVTQHIYMKGGIFWRRYLDSTFNLCYIPSFIFLCRVSI